MLPENLNPSIVFEIRECLRPGCELRFPAQIADPQRLRCPKCRADTIRVETYHPSTNGAGIQNTHSPIKSIEVLVDNVRSKLNVGAIFRISDGAGINRVHLCGITPTPEDHQLKKTGLGAEVNIPWEYHSNAYTHALDLRNRGYQIWGLETSPESCSLFSDALPEIQSPIILTIGAEVTGLDPAIQRICDQQISLPMMGKKESLNVAVAFGIAIYTLQFKG